jgi:hypothetical protein
MVLNQIEQINLFRIREKFSDQAWNERGLNPSDPEVCSKLTRLFDEVCQDLLGKMNKGCTKKEIKAVLKSGLKKFARKEYDTEEREFICDLFFELATILEIEFKEEISIWLYGRALTFLQKLQKERKALETFVQECETCKSPLESFVMQKREEIPIMDWMIVQCNKCGQYNLLDIGSGNIKELKFGNYKPIENLPRLQYTFEEASIRLEQIRTFRHN